METQTTKKPILIIDDEASILQVLEKSLFKKGYRVETAATGEEGIRKIENHEYSLILTDIKMPDVSGDQVFDHLRNKIKKATPIVAMSGTPWLMGQSDFDAVLLKPYQIKELLKLIHQLTERSQGF